MSDQCAVCGELTSGITETIKILDNDNKTSIHITGCLKCSGQLWDKIQNMKDFKTKPLKKVIQELNLDV